MNLPREKVKLTENNFHENDSFAYEILICNPKLKQQILENQKLRELIEKWIDRPECSAQTYKYLKSILDESKK